MSVQLACLSRQRHSRAWQLGLFHSGSHSSVSERANRTGHRLYRTRVFVWNWGVDCIRQGLDGRPWYGDVGVDRLFCPWSTHKFCCCDGRLEGATKDQDRSFAREVFHL